MLGRLLGNNTPNYHGDTRPPATARRGLLSFLIGGSGLFAKAPPYAQPTPPQPTPITGQPTTPIGVPTGAGKPAETGGEPSPEDSPAKRVTIIVTPGPGTTVNDVAAFFRDRCGIDG